MWWDGEKEQAGADAGCGKQKKGDQKEGRQ